MQALIRAPAGELADAIRQRKVSVLEAVDAYLARIEAVDPELNAVVRLRAEEARREALAADALLAVGAGVGPLHGVPFTIKDSIDTAGTVSTWGTPGRARFVPERDAPVVARLRAAGAILLGKTNTPELTLSFETQSPLHGRTSNPFDPERTSGGSSGGAAALVSAAGCAFDLGSDTGGSIRVPAHFCGCAGLRPTSGRVPRTGHAIPPGGLLDSLTSLGPIARSVADLARLLECISGEDGHDPFVAPVPLGQPARVRLPGLRIALHTDNGIRAPTPEIARAVRDAGGALAEAGCKVDEVRPPGIEESLDLFLALMRADAGASLGLLLERAGTHPEQSSLREFFTLPGLSAAEQARLVDRWDRFRTRLLGFVQAYDGILCPPCAIPAPHHGASDGEIDAFAYTMTFNLTGWPAAVVPVAGSPEGLPIGVQVVARPWREDVALALAGRLETAFGGWQPPPL
jgi:amidase